MSRSSGGFPPKDGRFAGWIPMQAEEPPRLFHEPLSHGNHRFRNSRLGGLMANLRVPKQASRYSDLRFC